MGMSNLHLPPEGKLLLQRQGGYLAVAALVSGLRQQLHNRSRHLWFVSAAGPVPVLAPVPEVLKEEAAKGSALVLVVPDVVAAAALAVAIALAFALLGQEASWGPIGSFPITGHTLGTL